MHTTANRMSLHDFHIHFVFVLFLMLTLLCTNEFANASPHVAPRFQTTGLSIPFMVNQGQIENSSVLFYAKTFAGTVLVHQNGDMFFQSMTSGQAFIESLSGCLAIEPHAKDPSLSKISMFYPHTLANNNTQINAYHHIFMADIYPDISMKLKAYGNTVEKIFILNPGANPDHIQVNVKGVKKIQTNNSGELEILPQGVRYSTPKAYQIIDGKQVSVPVQFKLCSNTTSYGFKVESYDKNYPLIIDPFISGTFFGGDDRDEIKDVAVNASGEVYVAGTTWSSNMPLTLALSGKTQTFDPTNHVHDIFVARFNSNLTQLLSATFIGGSEFDTARAIELDPDGNVFVCGQTTSSDFPIPGAAAFKKTHQGEGDGIVIRMSADLTNMLSASFFGGSKSDMPEDMAIDPTSKEIYITGYTNSSDFDITGILSLQGNSDAFVSRFTNDLSQMPSSRYLGGDKDDKAFAIEINSFQDIIIGGQTYSSNFPTRIDSYDQTPNGNMEAFICEISKDLSVIMGGTYLGGNRGDKVTAIVLDSENQIYATGTTSSENFPITNTQGIYSNTLNGTDVFVAKFDKDLRKLYASTFLGGIEWENASAMILDSNKNIMIAGTTVSQDFPATPGSFDQNYNGGQDIFIATFTP
ncbi:cell surface glycoprotein (s-layer protein) related protein, partial [Candidatus Magnetomorum sp. HK-1]